MVRLQFISHYTERYTYSDSIRLALEGGCRWIQLRMKDASDEEFLARAREARTLCDRCGAVLILDDRVHLVGPSGADGVHLGKLDMPVREARRILGPGKLIGGTANTFEDLCVHVQGGADYIGCGPFRYTETKRNLAPVLGTEGYVRILGQMRQAGIRIPLVAIGGITAEDLPGLRAAGVTGFAVSGSILRAADPAAEMARFVQAAGLTEREQRRKEI